MLESLTIATVIGGIVAVVIPAIYRLKGYVFIPTYGVWQKKGDFLKDMLQVEPKRRVLIVDGNLEPRLWDNGEFKEWIENSAKKGAEIKIITGPSNDPKCKETIKRWIKDGLIELRRLNHYETFHFAIADDAAYIQGHKDSYFIPRLAEGREVWLLERFNRLWNNGKIWN